MGKIPAGGHNSHSTFMLENPLDRGLAGYSHRVTRSRTQLKQLGTHASTVQTLKQENILFQRLVYQNEVHELSSHFSETSIIMHAR